VIHEPLTTTTHLASTTIGHLRAARACADVTYERIAVALDMRDARLGDVPPGQLLALAESTAALETAAVRVLRRVDPSAAQLLASVVDLCREGPSSHW